LGQIEDLVAIWKTKSNQRFQNYQASFSILNINCISREWINDLLSGNPLSCNAPPQWVHWVKTGEYSPLVAPKARKYRTKFEQQPASDLEFKILNMLIGYFKNHKDREYAFQKCAAEIARLMDKNIIYYELNRWFRDGGRDATGIYRIGTQDATILVEFALEAKCKSNRGSGVKETSRLISRLRYRQFGIFITTSYVSEQAYQEIVEDGHPVMIISGGDIAKILIHAGYNTDEILNQWLRSNFP